MSEPCALSAPRPIWAGAVSASRCPDADRSLARVWPVPHARKWGCRATPPSSGHPIPHLPPSRQGLALLGPASPDTQQTAGGSLKARAPPGQSQPVRVLASAQSTGAADDAGTVEPAQVQSDDSSSDSRLQRDCARLQRLLHEKKGLQREVARVWPMTCSPLSQRPRAQASQQEQGHHTAKGPEGTASGSTASFSGTGPQGPSATGGHTRGPNTTK